jgi:uncharacterized membrane protein YuzA (DUF378 family)
MPCTLKCVVVRLRDLSTHFARNDGNHSQCHINVAAVMIAFNTFSADTICGYIQGTITGREDVMRALSFTSFILVIIGAINWLLVGIARFDLVRWIFGRRSLFGRIVYSLVGLGGLTQLTNFVLSKSKGRTYPATS